MNISHKNKGKYGIGTIWGFFPGLWLGKWAKQQAEGQDYKDDQMSHGELCFLFMDVIAGQGTNFSYQNNFMIGQLFMRPLSIS